MRSARHNLQQHARSLRVCCTLALLAYFALFLTPCVAFAASVDKADEGDLLISAAQRNDVATIRQLAAAGTDLDYHDARGASAISAATFNGAVNALIALIELGAKINGSTSQPGFSPLRIAISRNQKKAVSILLRAGAKVHERLPSGGSESGDTALMEAIYWYDHYRDLDIIMMLLAAGASANDRNTETYDGYKRSRGQDWLGMTVLAYAASRGHPTLVRLLLKNGADPTVVIDSDITALTLAEAGHHPQTADVIRSVVPEARPNKSLERTRER